MQLLMATLGDLGNDGPEKNSARRPQLFNFAGEEASGARDWRMLAPALTMWAMCLATAMILERMREWFSAAPAMWMPPWLMLTCMMCLALLGIAIGASLHSGTQRERRSYKQRSMVALMMIVAGLLAVTTTSAAVLTSWRDPAYQWAQGKRGTTTVTAVVQAPALRSDIRQYDCQAPVRLSSITEADQQVSSSLQAMVFGTWQSCASMRQGTTVRVTGSLGKSSFGNRPVWLTTYGDHAVTVVQPANSVLSLVSTMRDNFFELTDRLSEQGQVLVPGLTVGILGQDRIAAETAAQGADTSDAYSAQVERWFMLSGIMHLMAVSGGHFLLLAAMCKRVGAILRLPRRLVAIFMLVAFTALALMVYPAASVWRAWGMGLLMCVALWIGRPFQTVAGLSWLVMLTTLFDYRMAGEFGFALSCSAVLAMAWLAPRIAEALQRVMPSVVAEGLAYTISAQMGTMPIQVLLEPQLPLWSIPANLLVAPVITFATVLGLLGFVLASLSPALGYGAVWLAQCATGVIEAVARWLSTRSLVMIPWAGGALGAVLMLAVEASALIGVVWVGRCINQPGVGGGVRYRHHLIASIRVWWKDTIDVLQVLSNDES